MRYGEPPSFLSVSQVVAGYTLQGSAQASGTISLMSGGADVDAGR